MPRVQRGTSKFRARASCKVCAPSSATRALKVPLPADRCGPAGWAKLLQGVFPSKLAIQSLRSVPSEGGGPGAASCEICRHADVTVGDHSNRLSLLTEDGDTSNVISHMS